MNRAVLAGVAARLGMALPRTSNAASAGVTSAFATHWTVSLITGSPALPDNRVVTLNLVTLATEFLPGPDTSLPHCPTCR
ncbi:hypothetical protein [Actinokineospora sp. NBRC 105648]|uniref:hypothetical protein n=1 Tax=Actinokineospora sp. NBRC 105648 TaxID=3032206 RepID=UPI0024A1C6CB|nr:hypothetical protein [Actinokineospora sp. NBRC 105648]GLZ36722.1 hypothetical protein Acsp05_03470 [Actinokineospora sp. NBRC 105648]